MWLVLFLALAGGVAFVLSNNDMRTEITGWLNSQLGTEPTPVPVVGPVAHTPTPTSSPTPPTPTRVAVTPTSRPVPSPTHSPTVVPTGTATPFPTAVQPEFSIDDVHVMLVSTGDGLMTADLHVTIRNVTAGDAHRAIELLMAVDGGEPELISTISGIPSGGAESFVFAREFSAGTHKLTLVAGDANSEVSIDVDPATIAIAVPTATPTDTPTPQPTVTRTPMPTLTPVPTRTPQPTYSPTPVFVIQVGVPTPTPGPAVAINQEVAPHLEHLGYKQYMLALINGERARAGLDQVVLGSNDAAQLHAEAEIEQCFSSHWGMDGLKPYMRYSLAGGYQSNGENGHSRRTTYTRNGQKWSSLDYCLTGDDRGYAPTMVNIDNLVRKAMEGWMDSPGHRRNILDPWHRKVNVGIGWDGYNFAAVQHFEGDYVEYSTVPKIADGVLTVEGTVQNGARIDREDSLGVQVFYDSPPKRLTRGQVSVTYCYGHGLQVASLRRPLTGNQYWTTHSYSKKLSACPDPYLIRGDIPDPQSSEEESNYRQLAVEAYQSQQARTVTVPWITANEWRIRDNGFYIEADLSAIIAAYGEGVYTVVLWGELGGEDVVVSEYSIFHGITPPATYGS